MRTAATAGGTGTAARESATCKSVRFQEKRLCWWRRGDGEGGEGGGHVAVAELQLCGVEEKHRHGVKAQLLQQKNEKREVGNTEEATVEGGCLDHFWGTGQRRSRRGKSLK